MSLFRYEQQPIFTTQPLAIIDAPAASTHFMVGRAGFQPLQIILHHTGGTNSLDWLTHTSPNRVSCHRLIAKDGRNYKIVADDNTAYCAGFGDVGPIDADRTDPPGVPINLNVCTLNIELENLGNGRDKYSLAQMTMCAKQIIEWWGKYGFLPVLAHGHVDANKSDPAGFDWLLLNRLLRAELAQVLV